MVIQLNRTVIEFRKRRGGRFYQGVVVGMSRHRVSVKDASGSLFSIHRVWTRECVRRIDPGIRRAQRRTSVAPVVDVEALNKRHMRDWMSKKGGGDLASALSKALPLWKKELQYHDPSINPLTGERVVIGNA